MSKLLCNYIFSNVKGLDKSFLKFIKCNVLGNDFVLVDYDLNEIIRIENEVSKICNRKDGIGADDLILVRQDGSNCTMKIYNPDGSIAEMCGNALSCATVYFANKCSRYNKYFNISTGSGMKEVLFDNDRNIASINLGEPKIFHSILNRTVQFHDRNIAISHLIVGVPHTIIFCDNVEEIDSASVAKYMMSANLISYSTNVMVVKQLDAENIFIKPWERGGTGYSLSCGTGAGAAVVCGVLLGKLTRRVTVHFVAGNLLVEWLEDNKIIVESSPVFNFLGYWQFEN